MTSRSRLAPILIGLTLFTVPLVTGTTARAHHLLQAAHVPPPTAIEGRDMRLLVPVASSCGIAYCGWINGTVHVVTVYGEELARIDREVPYQNAAVLSFLVPGQQVRAERASYFPNLFLYYWIEVAQQDCLGPCHDEGVRLPSSGAYAVPVLAEP